MVDKKPAESDPKSGQPKEPDQHKTTSEATGQKSEPVAVDRPGFDLGGSTGKTTAGTGLGLGEDASEDSRDRSLPGRRGENK
ncbi:MULTISPECIES: hypothetical protein [Alphaproteobacteria]|uniref:Uncharacterized protein n=2 Tax=Alphaproteobacteria TaxID=28211 RepID=A0A512HFT7_9HYPH|nr:MULTISPECIES: hypothetical protein [Alphaproteobacteria]GEO84316.1 hypothetical protein RNA01_12480 [Ciceribacter naphthalenivorans]GLR24852.1 hypothetical protein GCM10007920_46460 [Ciceribacter naphthalenivorans]GLT07708.1 hypothetical protein GCM10007926_46460 [Sphingomonas psychrolutea]